MRCQRGVRRYARTFLRRGFNGGSVYINIGKLGTSRDYRKIGAYPRGPPGRKVKFSHRRKMFFKNWICGFDVSDTLMGL